MNSQTIATLETARADALAECERTRYMDDETRDEAWNKFKDAEDELLAALGSATGYR